MRHGPAPRHAPRLPMPRLLRHACLRHTPACAMPACDSATLRLLEPATLRHAPLRPCPTLHLRPQCSAAGGPHAWRAISALPPVANPLSPSPPRPSPQHGCPMSPAFTHRIQTIQPALLTAQMNDMPLDLSQSDLQARRGRTYIIPCTLSPMHRLYRHHSSRRLRRHCPRRLLRAAALAAAPCYARWATTRRLSRRKRRASACCKIG